MSDFKERVLNELDELNTKITALNAFFGTEIFKGLQDEDKKLLTLQNEVMEKYAAILEKRLARF